MTHWDSPILTTQEIIISLKDIMGMDVVEADIQRPDPRRWRYIYSQMYEHMTGLSIESTMQTMMRVMNINVNVSNPEAFEEAASQTAFTQCMCRILKSCMFTKFSFKDVIHPRPKTVRHLASCFINKLRNDDRVVAFCQETQEDAKKSLGAKESIERKNKELKQRLQIDEEAQVHRKANLQKAEDEAESLKKVLCEVEAASAEDKRKIQDVKLKKSQNDSDMAAYKQALEEKRQECEKLSRKIVQSPKKFQIELDRLEKKVIDTKAQLAEREQVLSESKQYLLKTKTQSDAAAKACKLTIEVQEEFDKITKILEERGKLKERLSEMEEAVNSLSGREEVLSERIAVRQTQRHAQANHSDLRQQSSQHKSMDLRKYCEKLSEDQKTLLSAVSQGQDLIIDWKLKIAEVDGGIQVEKQELHREETRLIETVDYLDKMVEKGFSSASQLRKI